MERFSWHVFAQATRRRVRGLHQGFKGRRTCSKCLLRSPDRTLDYRGFPTNKPWVCRCRRLCASGHPLGLGCEVVGCGRVCRTLQRPNEVHGGVFLPRCSSGRVPSVCRQRGSCPILNPAGNLLWSNEQTGWFREGRYLGVVRDGLQRTDYSLQRWGSPGGRGSRSGADGASHRGPVWLHKQPYTALHRCRSVCKANLLESSETAVPRLSDVVKRMR